MEDFLSCDAVVPLTGRLLGGAVEPARRELVEMHLLVCPPCLGYLDKLRLLHSALADLPGRPAPDRLLATVEAGPVEAGPVEAGPVEAGPVRDGAS